MPSMGTKSNRKKTKKRRAAPYTLTAPQIGPTIKEREKIRKKNKAAKKSRKKNRK